MDGDVWTRLRKSFSLPRNSWVSSIGTDALIVAQMQVGCVRGKCATGGHCSNQMMQDGLNAMLSVRRLPGKEMSLFASQQISPGGFVCQYTGEVVRSAVYQRRQMELKGAKNYYGMTITSNEVVDARVFGNVARSANHSCQPNCVVERWDVDGETCCGLFAKRLIENDEEITFDYGGGNATTRVRAG
ncbi:hypothetical protein PHMEG_00013031 [Phytophthora megakarya]|uniref:SET domain-containing protein n=1 Tax=Phytophthora megakarya TaxID=4795 RepID=A0A225W7B3_9STRA|nr:hypothetical protein PHMEG_00013031 [Phytophthora megakarya]